MLRNGIILTIRGLTFSDLYASSLGLSQIVYMTLNTINSVLPKLLAIACFNTIAFPADYSFMLFCAR